jgi:uncharacterized phage-associated protein
MIQANKTLSKVNSSKLAEYILEKEGNMSHLKIQKLLYFIEGYHLAYFDESLIDDNFEAWVHGPVSRELYNQLKDKSILYSDISFEQQEGEVLPSTFLKNNLTSEQLSLIDEVLDLYGKETAFALESITHQQKPWIETREGFADAEKCEKIIPKDKIKSYFKQFVG